MTLWCKYCHHLIEPIVQKDEHTLKLVCPICGAILLWIEDGEKEVNDDNDRESDGSD
jgi:Zn finger protein HypA/HybF involved in hydrogenase expression